jgi:methionyl-tRNA synthetase
MALDIPPPKQILTHAHWTLGHQKMAKSTGNVVNPFFAMDRFGVDTMRYYLAHDGGISDDADYGNHLIVDKYKKGLQGGLGNLVSRVTRPKIWSVRDSVVAGSSGNIACDDHATWFDLVKLHTIRDQVSADMDSLHPGIGLKHIMDVVYEVRNTIMLALEAD